MAWVMSTRRVLGGIEMFIGAVRVARIRWVDDTTWLDLAGHDPFEVENTSAAMKQVHRTLSAPPPEDASVGSRP